VVEAVVEMRAFAERKLAQCEDAANGGIGRGESSGVRGEMEGAAKMELVCGIKGHADSG
jgi:hypothetical protein